MDTKTAIIIGFTVAALIVAILRFNLANRRFRKTAKKGDDCYYIDEWAFSPRYRTVVEVDRENERVLVSKHSGGVEWIEINRLYFS